MGDEAPTIESTRPIMAVYSVKITVRAERGGIVVPFTLKEVETIIEERILDTYDEGKIQVNATAERVD